MAKNKLVDGFTNEQWIDFAQIAKQYPRPVRFMDNANTKIAMLNFYLNDVLPNGKEIYKTMEKGRLIAICYNLYHSADSEGVKDYSLKLLKKIID